MVMVSKIGQSRTRLEAEAMGTPPAEAKAALAGAHGSASPMHRSAGASTRPLSWRHRILAPRVSSS